MVEDAKSIFCRRLKIERKTKNLTQEKLGVLIGLEEAVANTRISRYETGIHAVEPNTAQRIATMLDVPLAYFYAQTDDMAELLKLYYQMNHQQQTQLLAMAQKLVTEE